MFEYIRTHQRLMQFLLLLIIFPSFAFFGIESYTRSRAMDAEVATVAGQTITQPELDAAMREQLDRFRQMYGAQFDSKLMNTPEVRQKVLDELIARRAIAAEIKANKISVTDAMLQQNILATPGLRKADGSFDNDKYKSLLAAQGMTPAIYQQRLRQDLETEQLLGAIQESGFMPKSVAERLALISEQEREVQEMLIKPADFLAQVKLSEEQIKAYYDKNAAQFEIPESAKIEYVVLNSAALEAQTAVTDAEVAEFYKNNQKAYGVDEQRRASHILIAAGKDASADQKAKAKAKAESLLAEVRKTPANFAKLAKENSEDPGSKAQGGDLDFIVKGAMVKPFEDAVYKLKQGEISDLVQTDFGYHIITVSEIRAAQLKSLEEVQTQIAADIKKQKAGKAYKEAAESFTNIVYEQPDSLKAVADKLKLKIEVAAGVTRQGNPTAQTGINNPKFLKAIFADDVLKKKHNSEAIEVAANTLMSGRIVEYKPASRRPLEEVKAQIQAVLTQTEAQKLAEKQGAEKLAALQANDATSGFAEAKVVSRGKPNGVSAQALPVVMKADTQKLPAFVGVALTNGGYAIYRIAKVNAGTPDAAKRAAEAKQMESALTQQDVGTYLEYLKKKGKATVNDKAVSKPVEQNP